MTDASEDFEGAFSIGCNTITNLRFADVKKNLKNELGV